LKRKASLQDIADKEFKELDKAYEESKVQLDNSKTKINELLVEIMEADLNI
jgi:hypothetical protein